MSANELQPGNVVRYIAKMPPAGHTWPIRGNLYRVRSVKVGKVALDPLDGAQSAFRYAAWVQAESVEFVSSTDPFLKKSPESTQEVKEHTMDKTDTSKARKSVAMRNPATSEQKMQSSKVTYDEKPATLDNAQDDLLGTLMDGVRWPTNEDGACIPLGERVFFRTNNGKIHRSGVLVGVGISNGESVVFAKYGKSFKCVPFGMLDSKPTNNSISSRINALYEQLTPEQRTEFEAILRDRRRINNDAKSIIR